jgi:diguanylate cyclase (GGDEF)-like protein
MKLATKINITLLLGAIAIVVLIIFNHSSYTYFSQRLIISDTIDTLEVADRDLSSTMLQNNQLASSNQNVMNKHISDIELSTMKLLENKHLQKVYPKTIIAISNFRLEFDKKKQNLYDFQIISSLIKNSATSISNLHEKANLVFNCSNAQEHIFLDTLSHINIIILKSTMPTQIRSLSSLRTDLDRLKKLSFSQESQQEIQSKIIQDGERFINHFETYAAALKLIKTSKTPQALLDLHTIFIYESDSEMREVVTSALLLVALYILSLGIIIYFIIRAERDILTDKLTGVQNRLAFEQYTKNTLSTILVLININKFKNFNDFYGVSFGDQILIQTARRLKEMVSTEKKAKLFRLGGDEFGIVCITHTLDEIEIMAKAMADTFQDTTMLVDNIEVSINISVAISAQSPLLETADMTLKELKKYHSKNTLLYTDDLHLFEHIKNNVVKTHTLENAIKNNKIFPHFQPIVSFETGKVDKYESLARLQLDNGEVQSIIGYLDILKESKYGFILTHIMIQKSCEIMQHKECSFSINLSINDIINPATITVILDTFTLYPNISSRIIFEILESEGIDDYQHLSNFIKNMKSHGCKIAIDDFGSGYSNFAHILNLDIDILKLDGSLIRNLTNDERTVRIVETIVNFSKQAGIQTIAEFVCDEEVYNSVKQLGIDYSQGYYTGKPEMLN